MQPPTVHLLAQGLRFARGSLTEVEKWIAQTPPERIAAEAAEVLRLARHHLTKFEAVLSAAPMTTRTSAETTPPTDRPALTAIRSRTE
jgi:hypothetical protein